MDLLLLAKVLWRKVWILIAIPIIAAIAAYLFTMNDIKWYTSSAQISTGFTINDQVQLSEEKFNIRDADVKFSNLLNSMNSSLAINLLSYRLLLHDLDPLEQPYHRPDPQNFTSTPEEVAKVRQYLKQKLATLKPLSTAEPEFKVARKYLEAYRYNYTSLKDEIKISRIPNTDFVQVDFTVDKPALAALGANAFVEEFIRYYNSLKSERTGESVDFLKQLVDEKKAALDSKLETQNLFKSNNNVLDVQGESGAKLGQISELERQRDEIRSNMHRLDLTRQRLNEEIRSVGAPNVTNGNQKILDLRERINRLNERYITSGSTNQTLLDSLNVLRDQLRVVTENSNRQGSTLTPGMTLADLQSKLKDADIEYEVQRSNLNMVNAKLGSLQYSFSGYASKEAKLSAIQKEVDVASQEYLAAVEKYNEAKNRLVNANNLRQTLIAVAPINPEMSKRFIIIGLAGFVSLALCFFVIIALELMDGSVRTSDKFKRIVGLPLAGAINKIDSRNFNIRTYFNQQNGTEETEVYKSLLRKLRHEIESMNAKVVLFTSPKKKDGKTFIMFSLAYVLSLINKRVLIIDTNFKNNSLSQILGRNQSDLKVIDSKRHRLLTGAQGQKKADEEFDHENTYDLINPTKYKNIYIVGNAGGGNESPAEILSGRDFTNLITVLADSFDYILLEGASLNDYSDTKELVRYADKVVAVFSADSSVKQLDRESIYYLKSLGKKFGGCVLNRVDAKDLKL
jgi:polysaccharide biosynthesis transport protein